jgi:acetylornithine deacetylase
LNINADTTAAEIAIALKAKHLLIVTTSGGLRRDGDIVNRCNETLSESGIADGWISDGMHVKLQTGLKAAKSGVKQVHIVAPGSLTDPDAGTLLVSDQVSGQMSGRASAVSVVQHSPRDPIEILQTLIRFPSITGNEAEIADWVEAWAHSTGLGVGRFENSVYCWLGDGDDCLLLNSHLDVVPPSSDHPYEPFDPMEVDGRIYGRGSVDAKASGAAMLAALASLTAEGWEPVSGRLLLALTECEEGTGKNNGLQRLLPHLPPAAGAIVGEPTSLQPCTSQKGMLILKATAEGKTAHAARPGLGENAIAKAARDIAVLQNLDFDRTHPDLGPITVAVTTIAGGTARNVIPEECTFFIDIRTTPAYTHDEIISYLQQRLESTLSLHSGRYVPRATPGGSRIEAAVEAAIPDGHPFGSPTVSDWAFLEDTPAIKLGPGDSNLSHTGAENISIEEVRQAVTIYADLAKSFFESNEADLELIGSSRDRNPNG